MSAGLSVLHLVNSYLPYSRPWIHRQMVGPLGVRALVLAQRIVDGGPDNFPLPELVALAALAPLRFAVARRGGAAGLRYAGRLAKSHVQAWKPDVAHAHFGHVAWQYLPLVRQCNVPLVTSFYGHDATELPARSRWRDRYQDVFESSRLCLCEGPALAAAVVGLGCPADKVRIQRLGIDPDTLPFGDRVLKGGEPLRVVVAARFKEKKGIPDAIAAVAMASRRVNIHLTIIGDAARDLEGFREKRRIARALGRFPAAERVTFTGRLGHAEFLRRARDFHVVLQPSRRGSTGDTEGGLPVSLIELAATGLPAVATRHADIPELVIDGVTGLLAEEGDIEALAGHLVALATDPALIVTLGRNAAVHVRQHFNDEECRLSLERHYQEACGKEAPARPLDDVVV